jgi:hypothetical protein
MNSMFSMSGPYPQQNQAVLPYCFLAWSLPKQYAELHGGLKVAPSASDKVPQRGNAFPLSGPRATGQPGCFPGWPLGRAACSRSLRIWRASRVARAIRLRSLTASPRL